MACMNRSETRLGTQRRSRIRDFLFGHGQTSVHILAERMGMSPATLRRDLAEMENAGQIERVHGAARIAQGTSLEVAFSQREKTNLAAKRAIATAAYERVRPGAAIFLDAGTTVLQLARRIRMSPLSLTVFTNGLVVANELVSVPGVQVNLLGGKLREENMSVAGALAQAMLGGLWFDQLFLGASAMDENLNVSSFDADEARLNDRMVSRSCEIYLLADQTKFNRKATFSVFQLSSGHNLLTDGHPGDSVVRQAEQCGVSIVDCIPDKSATGETTLHLEGEKIHA